MPYISSYVQRTNLSVPAAMLMRCGHDRIPAVPECTFEQARLCRCGCTHNFDRVVKSSADTADVVKAVMFAQTEGLALAVKGGGTSWVCLLLTTCFCVTAIAPSTSILAVVSMMK